MGIIRIVNDKGRTVKVHYYRNSKEYGRAKLRARVQAGRMKEKHKRWFGVITLK